MKILHVLINSNIYISLAAVFLTVETQIQLNMQPHWHPYLFLIFFATLFEYNLHRLVTILTSREASNSDKHRWINGNSKTFYFLVFCSVIGFLIAIIQAKIVVLLTLIPIAILTLFYSMPISNFAKKTFKLRQIPFLKIFLISLIWSTTTVMLPVIHNGGIFLNGHIVSMLIERFLFVFAITIPFDIRDMIADKSQGLKTIPLLIGVNKSTLIALLTLMLFIIISTIHYNFTNQPFLVLSFSISALTTIIFLTVNKIRNLPLYHYGILDGTMLLQGVLVLCFYQLNLIQ